MKHPILERLTPENGLIFRITHRDNLEWILRHGLHARNGSIADPAFLPIGDADLIEKRGSRIVPTSPGGKLDDYVPFYFTPFSPMLYKLLTGYGIQRRAPSEIVFFVSSLTRLADTGVRYLFTDRHAYLQTAQFFTERSDLRHVDFELLRRKDFAKDSEDPQKIERYQAEALAHAEVPLAALHGLACYNRATLEAIKRLEADAGVDLKVVMRPEWYFR